MRETMINMPSNKNLECKRNNENMTKRIKSQIFQKRKKKIIIKKMKETEKELSSEFQRRVLLSKGVMHQSAERSTR